MIPSKKLGRDPYVQKFEFPLAKDVILVDTTVFHPGAGKLPQHTLSIYGHKVTPRMKAIVDTYNAEVEQVERDYALYNIRSRTQIEFELHKRMRRALDDEMGITPEQRQRENEARFKAQVLPPFIPRTPKEDRRIEGQIKKGYNDRQADPWGSLGGLSNLGGYGYGGLGRGLGLRMEGSPSGSSASSASGSKPKSKTTQSGGRKGSGSGSGSGGGKQGSVAKSKGKK
ncbi:uncharacterized protein LY89DRAFT_684219 [Mollisia scopiformis]|uniref:Uncharacterized protein n=1 Tax=Mollisia scopiformis TaxID=149040 RepID=A0A194XEV3_MOLSC|nr:uncharacterized protein LY89DRAFT_684219 [Mollisia scopiformis]KUJ18297.1 hypothetical protein LY89DRAFT_684219 [Mollisia scopiformis]